MERELQEDFVETWYNLVPKIIGLAEDNEAAEFLSAYTTCDEVSDGNNLCVAKENRVLIMCMHITHTHTHTPHCSFSCLSADYRSFLALGCLLYMAPDVRTKTDHTKVMTLLKVTIIRAWVS